MANFKRVAALMIERDDNDGRLMEGFWPFSNVLQANA